MSPNNQAAATHVSNGDVGLLVSVVVPCYNGAKTVRAAVDSALNQTYPRIEVVVVDDGSTDDSFGALAGYDERVVVVRQPNRGLSAARNAAVNASRGDILVLLDADDILLPECVSNRVAIFEANPKVGLVAGYFREIDAEGNMLDRVPELRKVWHGNAFRQAVRRNWGPPVGWAFRREAFLRVGEFDPLLKSCEDWDFVIRVASRYEIEYDPTVQVLYRKSAGQMSSHHVRMLDASKRVHLKNRACATRPFEYWIDTQFGKFELGRRTLFAVLFETREGRIGLLAKLLLRYPSLIWVGVFAAFSFLTGKRASGAPTSGAHPETPIT